MNGHGAHRCGHQRHRRRRHQHLASLVGAEVTVTLEIEADIPEGGPENVVRTDTENCRTLKFTNSGFETE